MTPLRYTAAVLRMTERRDRAYRNGQRLLSRRGCKRTAKKAAAWFCAASRESMRIIYHPKNPPLAKPLQIQRDARSEKAVAAVLSLGDCQRHRVGYAIERPPALCAQMWRGLHCLDDWILPPLKQMMDRGTRHHITESCETCDGILTIEEAAEARDTGFQQCRECIQRRHLNLALPE